jgi:hypothetical protein
MRERNMDMIERLVVALAGIAVLGLGGPRVHAIQTHALNRCQQLQASAPVIEADDFPTMEPRRCPAD